MLIFPATLKKVDTQVREKETKDKLNQRLRNTGKAVWKHRPRVDLRLAVSSAVSVCQHRLGLFCELLVLASVHMTAVGRLLPGSSVCKHHYRIMSWDAHAFTPTLGRQRPGGFQWVMSSQTYTVLPCLSRRKQNWLTDGRTAQQVKMLITKRDLWDPHSEGGSHSWKLSSDLPCVQGTVFLSFKKGGLYQPLISALWRQTQVDLWVQG